MSSDKKAVMIRCVDERYTYPDVDARYQLPTAFDLTAAGSAEDFVESEVFRLHFFGQVRKLKKAGKNITKIYIVDHFDAHENNGCAAYGQDDSLERHEQYLRRAAQLITAEPDFTDFEIQLLLHDIDHGEVYPVQMEVPAEMAEVG